VGSPTKAHTASRADSQIFQLSCLVPLQPGLLAGFGYLCAGATAFWCAWLIMDDTARTVLEGGEFEDAVSTLFGGRRSRNWGAEYLKHIQHIPEALPACDLWLSACDL